MTRGRALAIALAVLGAGHALLGLLMLLDARLFYDEVAPFPPFNGHFIGDIGTFYVAVGAGLLAASWLPSWRVPILAVATLQYAVHVANHLADLDWPGLDTADAVANVVSIGLTGVVVGGLLWLARRDARAG